MEKKTIRLKLVGFTSKVMEDGILDIIKECYNVQNVDDPDYIIYWVYDYKHLNYDCIRIQYTSECYTPDFNDCDYAIGFDRLKFGDRYVRIPLYDLFQYKNNYRKLLNRPKFTMDDVARKSGFCNFVVSNCFAKDVREKIFDKLSEYKKVDSGGRFRNNIGGAVKDKFAFQQKYKFSIACENCSYDGYATEKIMEAFAAGSVPIYYGDPNIAKDFNPRAFVNVHDFKTLDDMLSRVKQIDENDELYLSMLNEPIVNSEAEVGDMAEFLSYIFEQPLDKAKRRSNSQTALSYEQARKRYEFFECHVYKYYKKALNFIYRLKTGTLLTSKRTK